MHRFIFLFALFLASPVWGQMVQEPSDYNAAFIGGGIGGNAVRPVPLPQLPHWELVAPIDATPNPNNVVADPNHVMTPPYFLPRAESQVHHAPPPSQPKVKEEKCSKNCKPH